MLEEGWEIISSKLAILGDKNLPLKLFTAGVTIYCMAGISFCFNFRIVYFQTGAKKCIISLFTFLKLVSIFQAINSGISQLN